MFENNSKLAPDLEWMLSSGQVDEATLIDALIREHYRELFQLGLALSNISLVAVIFAQQTLASAVLNAHHYKGKTNVRVWLFQLALDTWRRSSSQFRVEEPRPPESFLPQVLEQQFGFNQVEINTIMNNKEALPQVDQHEPDQLLDQDTIYPSRTSQTKEGDGATEMPPEFEPEPPLTRQEITELSASIQDEIVKKRRSKTLSIRIQALVWMVTGLILLVILTRVFPLITAVRENTPTPKPTSMITVVERVEITATPVSDPSPTPLPPYLVVHTTLEGESLADVARKYGVSPWYLGRLNEVTEDQIFSAGQQVIIGRGSSRYTWTTTPAPFTSPDLPPPLTLDSDTQTIQQRVAESSRYWNTLWAEIQVNYYGPLSYVGPPMISLYQTWMDQTINSSLTLTGDLSGKLSLYDLRTDFSSHQFDFETEERQTTSLVGYDYTFSHEIHNFLIPGGLVAEIGQSPGMSVEQLLEIQAIDQVAGREALVVDWRYIVTDQRSEPEVVETWDQGRFWIDTQRGVVLRLQYFFHLGDDPFVIMEFLVRDIVFDAVFPYGLFEPYQELPRRFAQSYNGELLPEGETPSTTIWDPFSVRPALAQDPPPADFDPASGQLTFHFKPDESLVDVYSDGYYLGGVKTTNPLTAICTRSPDGRQIALAQQPNELLDQSTLLHWFGLYTSSPDNELLDQSSLLHWFDLYALSPDVVTVPEISSHAHTQVANLAFSPDSRRLAIFGCAAEAECGVSMIDLQTGEYRRIMSLRHVVSLNWSPDGNYLAVFASFTGWFIPQKIQVIDLRNGELVYSGEVDSNTGLPADDSPTHDWGLTFTHRLLNLDSCAFPPE
jgi:LysM repeat protein